MKRFIWLIISIGVLAVLVLGIPVQAANSTTYTYTLNNKRQAVRTQDAYLPDRTITSLRLSLPEDIFIDQDDNLYIADTGNRRVLKYSIATNTVVMELVHADFNAPRGLYVTAAGDIYVADSGAKTVFRFSAEGTLIERFDRPDSPTFTDAEYSPYRVAVDNRGNLYIIGEGIYSGVIYLSSAGEFLGYFTTNKTTLTFVQFLQDIFFTDAQKENLIDRLPTTFSNVYADRQGLIYTATMGLHENGVKKHNTAGASMFADNWSTESVTDLTTDAQGIIYAADKSGIIAIYAPDGSFIFSFGAPQSEDDIAGVYSSLMSVAVDQNNGIWTIDSEKSFLQSYKPTEFTLTTYEALQLFSEGNYTQARDKWTDVLRLNQMSVLAHNGIGKAYLYEQAYDQAMVHFQVAGNRIFYSQAFWEIRNTWLQDNLGVILGSVIGLSLAGIGEKYLDRKRRLRALRKKIKARILSVRLISDLNLGFKAAFHPIDTFYDLKRKIQGSYPAALILFLLFFATFMFYQVGKAYIFQFTAVEDMDLNAIMWGFLAIAGLFVFCNYLVTSIKSGEGSLGDVFKTLAYATVPLTLAMLIITVLTYVVTYNEVFLLQTFLQIGGLWSFIILFLGLQEMHNYETRTTIKSFLITFLFMLIATVILLMLIVMFDQLKQFIESIVKELIANVTGQI